MKTSEQGLALIRRFEGFSTTPYRCPAGKLTIGYGHVMQRGEDWPCISQPQAEDLLARDVAATEAVINRLVEVPLKQCQFDALVSFTYNIGVQALEKSTLLRLLNAENPKACLEFGRWVYAAGHKSEGLIARRAAETALFSQINATFTKL